MKINVLKILLSFIFLIGFSFIGKANTFTLEKITVTKNDRDIHIDFYKPTSALKAIVIVSSGTGGLSEPYLDSVFKEKKINFDFRGGLVNHFIANGYGIAFHNVSGIHRLSECLSGSSMEERLKSVTTTCWDVKIRRTLDLNMLTEDHFSVFDYFEKNSNYLKYKKILLGFSEASHHISSLIRQNKVNPSGIVFIGAIEQSFGEHFDYQVSKSFYFEKLEKIFSITKKNSLTFKEIVELGKLNLYLEPPKRPPWGLGLAIGGIELTKDQFNEKRLNFKNAANETKKLWLSYKENDSFKGTIETGTSLGLYEFNDFSSAGYVMQAIKSTDRVSKSLDGYSGTVVWLYGQYDAVVKQPNSNLCQIAKYRCSLKYVDGVGHVLEDESGYPSTAALAEMLSSVESIYNSKSR